MKCLFCNNHLVNQYCSSCNVKRYGRNEVWINVNHSKTPSRYIAQYFANSKKIYLHQDERLIHVIINVEPNLKEINRFISKFIKMQYLI